MLLLIAAVLVFSVSCDGNPAASGGAAGGNAGGAGGSIDPKVVGTWTASNDMATETYTFKSDGSVLHVYDDKNDDSNDTTDSATWGIEDGMLAVSLKNPVFGSGDKYLFMKDGAAGKKEIALWPLASMPDDASFIEYTVNGNEYMHESIIEDESGTSESRETLSIDFPNFTYESYRKTSFKDSDVRSGGYQKYTAKLTPHGAEDAYNYKVTDILYTIVRNFENYKVEGNVLTIGARSYNRQ